MTITVHSDAERYRYRSGQWGTATGKPFGCFEVPFRSVTLKIIVSDGGGWDHVSVSLPHRCPNWEEMCFVKNLFWPEHESVVQFHPRKSEYVNCHPYCLHMWRQTGVEPQLPPSIFVGPKGIASDL